jgi:transposase
MASVLEKRRFWARHVARFDGSGLTRRAYCDRHDLVPATLDYWRRRLRAEPAPAFVPVQARVEVPRDVPVATAAVLELSVGNARLILPANVDAKWLASLLQALR